MTELLPTRQASDLRRAITDYITTAISLADPSVDSALDAFLGDPDSGIFLGPYLRTRLPFAPAQGDLPVEELLPNLHPTFPPYAHQAAAYRRLTTNPAVPGGQDRKGHRLPEPVIVTTGTGSGKTESFLHPVLDHVVRARRDGIGGIKALILYPMNALANDQAARLGKVLSSNAEYKGISAALYTGEAASQPRTTIDSSGIFTDRNLIRNDVPDILLTNYKMLDQLLLRKADRPLWDASAESLRYLVLDEFHTYDGAQGTDVGMLLRRLRIVLEDKAPGRVHLTPVATSATLGDGDDAAESMLSFARTVFGTPIDRDAVITEKRVAREEFTRPAVEKAGVTHDGAPYFEPLAPSQAVMAYLAEAHLVAGTALDPAALTAALLDQIWRIDDDLADSVDELATNHGLSSRDLLLAHPLVDHLLAETGRAVDLATLATTLLPEVTDLDAAKDFTTLLLAALSHERTKSERNTFPSVETHLWIREVTRVDRIASTAPSFLWSDETTEDADLALPAVYCRHCGRSGWGVTTRSVGTDLDLRPDTIRQDSARHNGRFRALILDLTKATDDPAQAPTEETSRRRYLNLDTASLDRHGPVTGDTAARTLRVLVHAGTDADERSVDESCPACGEKDGIRFLGTSLATLLSVSLTSLFGTPGLDLREKKALVFTDSVQDAAHRAGFVEARSHSLSLRSVIHDALTEEPAPIGVVVERMIERATTPETRYRLLHPTITDAERLDPFWNTDGAGGRRHPREARRRATGLAARRLAFDLGLELGLTGQVGRTLLLTGSAVAAVRVSDEEIDAVRDRVLRGLDRSLLEDEESTERRWIRGVLERLRTRGAISHPWLDPFRKEGGPRYRLWGGRPSPDVMPAFPTGRALPGIPGIGTRSSTSELDDVTQRGGWYADWTARALGRERRVAASLVRPLFEALRDVGVLDEVVASSGTLRSFALYPDRVEAALPATSEDGATPVLRCGECRETVTGTVDLLDVLVDGPCPRHRCTGRLRHDGIPTSYYSSLYRGDMRRVVAREHTSLLTNEDRLDHETRFKESHTTPGSPNVLVATPTLEMGIDIGDLSTVVLASVPRTVASYLQRVGRAGRLSGNSLDITLVAGRGRAAGIFSDPLDMLNGTVRAPGAYLSAEEILRRQFLASVMDALAGDERVAPPTPRTPVLASSAPGTFLGHVLDEMRRRGRARVDAFLDRFETGAHAWDGLTKDAREALAEWALDEEEGSTGLEQAVHRAVENWNSEREGLRRRRARINENLDALQSLPSSPDRDAARQALEAEDLLISAEQEDIGDAPTLTDEEKAREVRRLRGSAGRLGADVSALESAHWIGVLERYALLPNFTLVDDAVTLDATLIWQDDDGHWKHEAASLARSGRPALTELAPGAHFYAHGRRLTVDAVDIGVGGGALHRTAFCPSCGRAERFERDAPPRVCPACRGQAVADPGQHRDVVDLTRVYSTMNRNRTRITDSSDDRDRQAFDTALSVAFDPRGERLRWHVPAIGLGVALDRETTLTRLNLGAPHQVAGTLRISGEDRPAPGFLVCSECGHHDKDTAGNDARDHQAWCSLRYAPEGKNTQALLSRTMRTETVLVTVPPSVLEDPSDESLWNLVAALQLGIEDRFGGSIGNIDLDIIAHPDRGERALLLSDEIPGGTGYLMELATEESMWELLAGALSVLENCPCRDEGLTVCHRCLLPHVPYSRRGHLRRELAIGVLQDLLGPDPRPGAMAWKTERTAIDSTGATDSDLERRFRRAFRAAATALPGASVSVRSSDRGEVVSVLIGGRTFTLGPQVDIAGTRPDYVLTWQGSDIEGIAVYTDGATFHASGASNRIADDAVKRMRLRRHGYLPLVVTHADLDEDLRRKDSDDAGALPRLFDERTADLWVQKDVTSRAHGELLRATPMGLLMDVLRHGSTQRLRYLAEELPQMLISPGGRTGITTARPDDAPHLAGSLLDGRTPPPQSTQDLAVARRHDFVAAVGLLHPSSRGIALVLDDRDRAVREDGFLDSWRAWGRVANLAQGDPSGHTLCLTTTTLLEQGIDVRVDMPASGEGSPLRADHATAPEPETPFPDASEGTLDPAWAAAYEDAFTEQERQVIRLASALGIEPPTVGEEYGRGIPLDVAWPDRRTAYVAEELSANELRTLQDEGWNIVGPSTVDVLDELGLTEGHAS
ncbi:MAG: DEAD/DEAH box helicase [Brachybacterium sp.]|uniref:DEAD/DEAH box helicase n=1 Tax=Brachybacterium sp. TaxID=1891286 RepID=UPI0032424216